MPKPRNQTRRTNERLMDQLAAAKRLKMDRSTVLRRALAGHIDYETVDGTVKLVRASVERYAARLDVRATTAAA